MSETLKPKLRENFANYLDHVVGIGKGIAPPSEGSHHYEAMVELQQLRAKAAAYIEAMEWLAALHEGGLNERLDEFMRSEIESGRFRP